MIFSTLRLSFVSFGGNLKAKQTKQNISEIQTSDERLKVFKQALKVPLGFTTLVVNLLQRRLLLFGARYFLILDQCEGETLVEL